MKRMFSTNISATAINFWLFIFRVVIGLFMLTHGIPKLQMLMSGNVKFADPIGIGQTASLMLCIFAEVVCSLLLILGLAARFAAISLIINMLVAVFTELAKLPFGKKELALIYLLVYFGLLISGAGKYSFDNLIAGGKNKKR